MTAIQDTQKSLILSNTQLQLFSGAVAGVISRSFVAPFERLIILRQTNDLHYGKQSIISTLLAIMKNEGPKGLFKGNLANCFRIGPFQAIEFYTFDLLNNTLQKQANSQVQKNSFLLLSGGIAGAFAMTVVYPFDITKTVLAVQTNNSSEYRGIFPTMLKLVRQGGIFSLWRGFTATLMGITPYASLKLSFFQIVREYSERLMGKQHRSSMLNMMYGGLAGCMALTITYPTDVIRRRMQVQILQSGIKSSYLETIRCLYQSEGLRYFYRGLFTTYLKVIPSTAIAFAINEKLNQRL